MAYYVDLELDGFEWDIRKRAAEAITRGDTVDPRDLEWMAEGYLKLLGLVDEASIAIHDLESDLNEPVGRWTFTDTGESATERFVVAVTWSMYQDLIEEASLAGINESSVELDVARVTLGILKIALDLRKVARGVADAADGLKKALSA